MHASGISAKRRRIIFVPAIQRKKNNNIYIYIDIGEFRIASFTMNKQPSNSCPCGILHSTYGLSEFERRDFCLTSFGCVVNYYDFTVILKFQCEDSESDKT